MAREDRGPRRRLRPSPGGVGDGLPAMPDGEPLLARWFAVAMILLAVAGVTLTVVALTTRVESPEVALPPAERRPTGTDTITHDRGETVLAETTEVQRGVSCAPNLVFVGDEGGRSTVARAFETLCRVLEDPAPELDPVRAGLELFDLTEGTARIALGAATGVDSSALFEDGGFVIELAPKFQFEDAARAAPVLAHELTHIGRDRWPGDAVDALDELAALTAQSVACDVLAIPEDPPRGCLDAAVVVGDVDPLLRLQEAGYAFDPNATG